MLRVTIVEISPSLGSSIEPQGLSEEISKQLKTISSSNISLSVEVKTKYILDWCRGRRALQVKYPPCEDVKMY